MLQKLIKAMEYLGLQEMYIMSPKEYIEKNRERYDNKIIFRDGVFTFQSSMTDGHNRDLFDIKRKNISHIIKDDTVKLFINKLSEELRREARRNIENRLIEQELIKKELEFILE